jgi:hypothetical protein
MLQELKYVSTWNDGQYPKVLTDAELVQMVTTIPAQFAGLFDKIGTASSLDPPPTSLVVRRTEKDPYLSLLNALTRRQPHRPHRRQPRLRRRRPDGQTLPPPATSKDSPSAAPPRPLTSPAKPPHKAPAHPHGNKSRTGSTTPSMNGASLPSSSPPARTSRGHRISSVQQRRRNKGRFT